MKKRAWQRFLGEIKAVALVAGLVLSAPAARADLLDEVNVPNMEDDANSFGKMVDQLANELFKTIRGFVREYSDAIGG